MTMAAVQQAITLPLPALKEAPTLAPLLSQPASSNGGGIKLKNEFEMDVDGDSNSQPMPLENGAGFGGGPKRGDARIAAIIFGRGQEKILSVFAEVLGQPFRIRPRFGDITTEDNDSVVGIAADDAAGDLAGRDTGLVVVINAHCVNLGMPPAPYISANCDYEFLYSDLQDLRRELARFVSFTLGQINHHQTLMAKPRTFFISTTFPDVRAALPNIDILTVGADAVELRVDLLREPLADGTFAAVPSLSYVGQQVMLLRQRTELPIIFTTRCTHENGRFPMDDPELYHSYLFRAIQWGVEYIDVELWLPEHIRQRLNERKGSSRIMSAFHDFSGTFRWPSGKAREIFIASSQYADIVKMNVNINDHGENFELESFRHRMREEFPHAPPLSAVNMGEIGQFSRTLNRVLTPITHPLLPLIAAPGQMSASEINTALALLGQLPKKTFYRISESSSRSANPMAPFYEKCFNELGLPHLFAIVERPGKPMSPSQKKVVFGVTSLPQPPTGIFGTGGPSTGIDAWCNQKNFGGAYLSPPASHQGLIGGSDFFQSLNGGAGPVLTEAARLIGMVDTIVVRPGSSPATSPAPMAMSPNPSLSGREHSSSPASPQSQPDPRGLPPSSTLVFDNAAWRGILSTLTRDLAPSAYFGCAAVLLARSADDAASAVFALRELRVRKLFTVGFKVPQALAHGLDVEPFNSIESLRRARASSGTSGNGAGDGGEDDGPAPFVVISALGAEMATMVGMMVRLFGSSPQQQQQYEHEHQQQWRKRVFLDLADAVIGPTPTSKTRGADPTVVAEQFGYRAYGAADAAAFTTVERLRLLVGQNVPYNFVRLASGRVPY